MALLEWLFGWLFSWCAAGQGRGFQISPPFLPSKRAAANATNLTWASSTLLQ